MLSFSQQPFPLLDVYLLFFLAVQSRFITFSDSKVLLCLYYPFKFHLFSFIFNKVFECNIFSIVRLFRLENLRICKGLKKKYGCMPILVVALIFFMDQKGSQGMLSSVIPEREYFIYGET